MFSPSISMDNADRDTYELNYNSFKEKELLYLILLELKKLNKTEEDY